MNHIVKIIALASLAPLSFAQADEGRDEASLQETAGLGIGGVVGALAGGPVGFIVGAAGGAIIGDKLHRDAETVEALTWALDESTGEASRLRYSLAVANEDRVRLDAELKRIAGSPEAQIVELLRRGVEIDVLYRTDEFETPALARTHLGELGVQLANVPGARIRLDGYADPRGDARYNLALSKRRAAAVREVLLATGMREEQIEVIAHGSIVALDDIGHRDDLALERRVNVRLYLSDDGPDGQVAGL